MHRATAPMSRDYVYEDYGAPRPLTKGETQAMVARFLGALVEFKLASKPSLIAAGDDVVTETDEIAVFKGATANPRLSLHSVTIMRFKGGEVVKQWQYASSLELLSQLKAATQ